MPGHLTSIAIESLFCGQKQAEVSGKNKRSVQLFTVLYFCPMSFLWTCRPFCVQRCTSLSLSLFYRCLALVTWLSLSSAFIATTPVAPSITARKGHAWVLFSEAFKCFFLNRTRPICKMNVSFASKENPTKKYWKLWVAGRILSNLDFDVYVDLQNIRITLKCIHIWRIYSNYKTPVSEMSASTQYTILATVCV